MFGRPMMSEEEMEAVDSGGAENAPKVYKPFSRNVVCFSNPLGTSFGFSINIVGIFGKGFTNGFIKISSQKCDLVLRIKYFTLDKTREKKCCISK